MSARIERFGRIWIEADALAARRYLARSLMVPHGRRERLGLILSRIAPDERAAVTHTARGAPEEARFAAVGIALSSIAEKDERPRWILMEDYEGGRGRSIVFLFAREAEEPFAVVKVRPAGEGESLRRERNALERLGGSGVRGSVPAVRAYREDGGWETLALTSVRGRSIYREMKAALLPRVRVDAHFESAAAWLERFQESAPGAHGDFWGRNILLDGAGVSAVDWEDFDAEADPLLDVFHFPLTYALAYRWDGSDWLPAVERFHRGFVRRNGVSRATARWMRRFAERNGVAVDDLRRKFCDHLARGSEGEIGRPRLEAAEWSEMLKQTKGETPCAFSG